MTAEEMMKMFQSRQSSGNSDPDITEAKLDEFIDRCTKERDETLMTLGNSVQRQLNQVWLSTPQHEVYPLVLRRIQQRLQKGEQ